MSDHHVQTVAVPCPQCFERRKGNRRERRMRSTRKCSFCKGTGIVLKSVPMVAFEPFDEVAMRRAVRP